MREIIFTSVVGGLIVLLVGVAFYIGKKDSSFFGKSVFDADKSISKKFLDVVDSGEEIDKDFLIGVDKKGVALAKNLLDADLSNSKDFDFDGFFGGDKKFKDYKKDFDGSHYLVKVKRNSNKGFSLKSIFKSDDSDHEVFIIPEKMILEGENKLVVDKDVTFFPFEDKIWLTNTLGSLSIYQSINFMDMFGASIKLLRENMEDLQHMDKKHSQKIEELDKMSDNYRSSGFAGDLNKYSNN